MFLSTQFVCAFYEYDSVYFTSLSPLRTWNFLEVNMYSILKSTRFYSGVVAGAREALICGVPSLSISLNWWVVVLFHMVFFCCLLATDFFAWSFLTTLDKWFSGFITCCRKKDESQESDFKDAVVVCLPLINAVIRDIEKGIYPNSCSLNVDIPTSPLSNKVCVFEVLYWFFSLKIRVIHYLCILIEDHIKYKI